MITTYNEVNILICTFSLFQITGSHLVQCHLQMACTETSLNYLMSYVPENKAAAYFPVSKNHVLTEIMLEFVHIYEKKPLSVLWAYFEHQSLVQLGKKLKGTVPNFENI